MAKKRDQETRLNPEIEKKYKASAYLNRLIKKIERDLTHIDSSKEDKVDSAYVNEIAGNIEVTIENLRDQHLSSEMKDSYGRIMYILKSAESGKTAIPFSDIRLELGKVLSSLKKELEKGASTDDPIDKKKEKMLKELVSGLEKDTSGGVVSLVDAEKAATDLSKIRDLYISDNLKGILGRALYLKEKAKDSNIDDVKTELYKISQEVAREIEIEKLRESSEKEFSEIEESDMEEPEGFSEKTPEEIGEEMSKARKEADAAFEEGGEKE